MACVCLLVYSSVSNKRKPYKNVGTDRGLARVDGRNSVLVGARQGYSPKKEVGDT